MLNRILVPEEVSTKSSKSNTKILSRALRTLNPKLVALRTNMKLLTGVSKIPKVRTKELNQNEVIYKSR
jgi:hypothetical protein